MIAIIFEIAPSSNKFLAADWSQWPEYVSDPIASAAISINPNSPTGLTTGSAVVSGAAGSQSVTFQVSTGTAGQSYLYNMTITTNSGVVEEAFVTINCNVPPGYA